MRGKSIWVAVLEGAGIWHEQAVSADDAKQDLTLDWKPPFSAKWRADLLAEGGSTLSWYFRNLDEVGRHGVQDGDSPPVCSLEDGRAVLRLRRDPRAAPLAWHYPAKLVVYAMDRDRATPLTTFCPMDVLRNTLGVGPCQYILQTEGLGAEVTPDSVMTWVEKQFPRRKRRKRPRKSVNSSTQWSPTCGTPRGGSVNTAGWPEKSASFVKPRPTMWPRPRWTTSPRACRKLRPHGKALARRSQPNWPHRSPRYRQGRCPGGMPAAGGRGPRDRRRPGCHVVQLPHGRSLAQAIGRDARRR